MGASGAGGEGMPVVRYPRPAILDRIPRSHAVIEASAGTGKTFTLEHLVVDLLATEAATIDEILAVTFTERATRELRARVRQILAAVAGADARSPAVAAARAGDEAGGAWVIDGPTRARLRAALQGLDAAPIHTIHAFCQRALLEHAFASHRLFVQEQVDGREAFAQAFRDALRQELARSPGPMQVLRAALGAGWTVPRLEELLFAALRHRGTLVPRVDLDAVGAALDAYPLTVDPGEVGAQLRQAGLHARSVSAVVTRLTALGEAVFRADRDPARFLCELDAAARPFGGQPALIPWVLERVVGRALPDGPERRLVAALQELAVAAVPLEALLVETLLRPTRARLEERKRRSGLYDFDDMLLLVGESLRSSPRLARALRDRYRVALVDEFQDTDAVQWEIFRRLFFDSAAGRRLYAIGDPKQAIYGFRGADVQTYVAARADIAAVGGVVALQDCYRATPPLIEAINCIFDQKAPQPFFDEAGIAYDNPVRPGAVSLQVLGRDGRDACPVALWEISRARKVEGVREVLGLRLAREVAALIDPVASPLRVRQDGELRALRPDDIFVLTRTAVEGRLLGDHLRAAGIPHAYYKEGGLFQREEARHVRDLLAGVASPHDPACRLRALLTPFFGVSLAVAREARIVPESHRFAELLARWHDLGRRREHGLLFRRILEESGLVRRELFLEEGERRLTNYLHLFELLLEEGKGRLPVGELSLLLQGFIDGTRQPLQDDPGTQRQESARSAVQLMTMHKAKGLQALVVFVAGGFTRPPAPRPPHRYHDGAQRLGYLGPPPEAVKAAIDRAARGEDARLLYVALTRARGRLYLPFFPADGAYRPHGAYARVNQRLQQIVPGLAEGAPSGLFQRDHLDGTEQVDEARERVAEAAGSPARVAQWEPPPELLREPVAPSWIGELRDRRRGFVITSYTQLRAGEPHPVAEVSREELLTDGRRGFEPPPATGELPGGAASGIFLHGVLEEVSLEAVMAAGSLEAWRQQPEVQRLVARQARRAGVDGRYAPHAEELVYRALTSPVRLGQAGVVNGLATARRALREMEFLYPIPGSDGERGYLKGFVDLLFEHRGLAYFADWKSDILEEWTAVGDHVARSYLLQAKIYAVALSRLLQVRSAADYEASFGGLLYCFLRGMRSSGDGTAGVYFARPTWEELQAWAADVSQAALPKGGSPPETTNGRGT